MASPRRRPTGSLIERLTGAPHAFDFVQALRLIEARGGLGDDRSGTPGDAPPDPARPTARFVTETRLRYPHATLTAVRLDGAALRVTVSGFGLLGPVGVLPFSYTSLVADSLHANNPGLKAFVDLFQHRAVTLFYGAASKYRIVISHDRRRRGEPDRFGDALAHMTGLGLPSLRGRLAVPDETILHFAGLFSSKARTVAGLETILADALDAPVRVEPLVGRWLAVAEDEQTRIGREGPRALGRHGALGSSAMIGTRTWSVQSNFRVVVGPVGRERIASLLPGGRDAVMVADLVGLYGGLEYEVDLNLVIRAAAVPRTRLATACDADGEVRLGQTSWLLSADSPVDRDDAVFALAS
ncbi:type VI secretion system baseplate subunit TssG [Methylobacterium oryzihabitans]|uniref:Type VI secretion system baseplate subunit TssG n=1 Tax=Methylobacterium oryzihabitans TaxID=2499852 RepID=A0A437P3U2_9HYPH|nr:type VI secretion system baseplate subunit TssG [Methylobacterium oryzihabitans]RVU16933.1 type VI secretion system baseplate subunit TssG [Methylobacterium oryzihabitans]